MNPWVIVGFLASLIGACVGGYFYGEHVENLSWTAAVEKQHAQAATELAAATAKTAALEKKLADINTQVETEHADHQATLDAAFDENQRLTAQLSSLFNNAGSGADRTNAVPGTPKPAAGHSKLPPAYRELSGVVADLLNRGTQLARDADREANAASECHDWAVKVSGAGQ
jgi:Protein of unknown function (DUF2514)